jgi:hypothetical protein
LLVSDAIDRIGGRVYQRCGVVAESNRLLIVILPVTNVVVQDDDQ